MATLHGFIPENCVGRKVKWEEFNHWMDTSKTFMGIVKDAGEDCLYIELDDGSIHHGLMKDLELGDAMLEWL